MLPADRRRGAHHAPEMKFDWTVNRGVSAGLADATQAYPGDDYVDIVGIDSYDSYPGAKSRRPGRSSTPATTA